MQEYSDNELVKKYCEGNKESFEILVNRHLRSVYFYCLKMVGSEEANDITQETFVKVWKNINKFDLNKNFKVWMFRIARNSALDHLRKKQPTIFSELKNVDEDILPEETVADVREGQEELILKAEREQDIESALSTLSAGTREVFLLYYREELNFQEIADALGQSVNTVKSRHRRGLVELRKFFGL